MVEEEEPICSICCGELTVKNIVNPECGHATCKDCFWRWAKDKNSCPFCRTNLLKNTEEVAIDLIFIQYEQINIAFVMIGALAVGILIGYGVAVTSIISSKSESRSLKLKNRRLSDELNDLRNVAIDEGIYDNDDGED